MSGDGWKEFVEKLGTELVNSGGPLNKSKDDDLLQPNATALIYPQDLFAHGHQAFIFFNIRSTEKNVTQSHGSICLYMPQSVQVSYDAGWTKTNFPLEKMIDTAKGVYNDVMSAWNNRDKISFSVDDILSQATAAVGSQSARYVLHNIIRKELGPEYAAEFRNKFNFVINPYEALVYESPEFRHFNFTFQFLPKNPEEAEASRRIIKLFKLAMHPSRLGGGSSNLFWGFPYVFDVFLCTPYTDKMFMIKRSALVSAEVNYTPSGVQSFFKDGHPTHKELSLSFKELNYLTREDIKENY